MNEYIKTKETYFLFSKPFCFQEKASPNSHPPPILGFVMRAWLREPSAAISEWTKPSCSQATIRHLTRWLNYGNMLLGILIQLRTVATPPCLLFTVLCKPKKELFFLFLYLDILCTVCHGKWEGRVGIQSAGVVPRPGVCFAFTSEQMRAAPGSSSAATGDTAAITYLSAFDNHFQILFEKLYC